MAVSPYVNMSRDALIQALLHKDDQTDQMIDTINRLNARVKQRDARIRILNSELARGHEAMADTAEHG